MGQSNRLQTVLSVLERPDWDELHKQRSPECCIPILELRDAALEPLSSLVGGSFYHKVSPTIGRRASIALVTLWTTFVETKSAAVWVTEEYSEEDINVIGLRAEKSILDLLTSLHDGTVKKAPSEVVDALSKWAFLGGQALYLNSSVKLWPYSTVKLQFDSREPSHRWSFYEWCYEQTKNR